MKKIRSILFAALALLAAAPLAAQEREEMGPWKEMNAFHMALGPIWHPIEEKGDLAPLRTGIDRLVAAAEAWAKSTAPAACADVKPETVAGIAKDVQALAVLLRDGAPDARLKTAVEALHEKFEPIEQSCVNR